MEYELKTCPFCKSRAIVKKSRLEIAGIGHLYKIKCRVCGCQTAYFHNLREAAIAWNRRV